MADNRSPSTHLASLVIRYQLESNITPDLVLLAHYFTRNNTLECGCCRNRHPCPHRWRYDCLRILTSMKATSERTFPSSSSFSICSGDSVCNAILRPSETVLAADAGASTPASYEVCQCTTAVAGSYLGESPNKVRRVSGVYTPKLVTEFSAAVLCDTAKLNWCCGVSVPNIERAPGPA